MISGRRSDQALRQIRALIYEGKLAPGARLPSERGLAELVGVSRPILREALNTLEATGYIERRQKSGNYLCTAIPHAVRKPIDEGLDAKLLPFSDVIDLRKALEAWAAEQAARRPGRASVKALQEQMRIMKRTASFRTHAEFARYREADLAFHQVIARMTGNMVYIHLFDFLANLVRRSIVLSKSLVRTRFAQENLLRHGAILRAIERRDPEAARAAMNDHFALVERRLKQP